MNKSNLIVLLLVLVSFIPFDKIDWSKLRIPLPTPANTFTFDEPKNEGFSGYIANIDNKPVKPDVVTQCDCKGTGVIVAGDGTRLPCPFVNPTTGKCEWPKEPVINAPAQPDTCCDEPTPTTTIVQKRITSMEGYQSPGGWHRHRMLDGTILEHEDWNNGIPGTHNGAISYRTWRGMRYPRYTGPDLPSNVEFYIEETVPIQQQVIPPPPPVQAPSKTEQPKVEPVQVVRQVVMFTASWCGPCQNFKRIELPKLEALGFKVGTAKDCDIIICDIDTHLKDKAKFNIGAVPQFILFENKKEVIRLIGYQTADTIQGLLNGQSVSNPK